jgi:hypothetical protein
MKKYKIKYIGINTEALRNVSSIDWEQANSLIDFSSPWDNKPFNNMEFKALHDNQNIYFRFEVSDKSFHIHSSDDKNDSINNSDRVELFFRSDDNLNPYYCLEIDPTGRIMDFRAHPNKQFDFTWSWPLNHIKVNSIHKAGTFIVEIMISKESLKELSLLKGNSIETGIYRAKYYSNNQNLFEPTWITWVNPNTDFPNFHTASSFGLLELEDFS